MKAAAHLTLAAAALLCACGQSAPEGGRPLQAPGQVKLAFDTRLPPVTAQPASGSGSAPLLLPAICADFTLTPYSIDASGHHAQAGDPIQISETAAGTTAFIGGCTDSSAGDDWGYVVSATHWHLCPGDVLSQGFTDYVGAHFGGDVDAFLATLSPQIATSSIDLDCQAGKDIDADISVDVSVPIASSAGYVDIGVSVDVSQQSVGCKQADFGADGTLHFGEAAQYPQGQAAPLGFTGIGLLTPTLDPDLTPGAAPDAASVDQFAGVVTLGNTSTAFYTGTLAVSGGASYDVLQAFAPQCGDGMYYAQTQAVECDTRATQGAQGAWSAQTYAGLADVLMVVPGRLWVSARVGQANTLLLTTGTGSAASDASVPASAWNPLTLRQVLDFGAQGLTLLGVWPNQEQPSDLVALVDDGSGPGYIDVSFDAGAGTWSLDRRGATSLDGMSASDLASLGLFQQTNGCLKGVFHETTTTVTIDASSVFLGGHALSGTLSPLCGEVLVKPLVVSQDSFIGASNVSLLDDQHVTLDERVGTAKVNIFGGNLADRIDLRFAIESLAPCDAPGAVLPAFGGYPAQASYLSVTAGGLASAALPSIPLVGADGSVKGGLGRNLDLRAPQVGCDAQSFLDAEGAGHPALTASLGLAQSSGLVVIGGGLDSSNLGPSAADIFGVALSDAPDEIQFGSVNAAIFDGQVAYDSFYRVRADSGPTGSLRELILPQGRLSENRRFGIFGYSGRYGYEQVTDFRPSAPGDDADPSFDAGCLGLGLAVKSERPRVASAIVSLPPTADSFFTGPIAVAYQRDAAHLDVDAYLPASPVSGGANADTVRVSSTFDLGGALGAGSAILDTCAVGLDSTWLVAYSRAGRVNVAKVAFDADSALVAPVPADYLDFADCMGIRSNGLGGVIIKG